MPYHKDFDELEMRGEFAVEPEGWHPLTIEYGYDQIGHAQLFYWRVKGTKHTFKEAVSVLNARTGGNYIPAIQEFLESFREEIMGWVYEGIRTDWSQEYFKEYNQWIKI